jgi:hypothetical protein
MSKENKGQSLTVIFTKFMNGLNDMGAKLKESMDEDEYNSLSDAEY